MFDAHTKDIDAVIVACPDHVHASAAMWAMARGKHVYCEKPLTRTVWEAQQLTLAAAKYGVATQMGNQGYSSEGARQCCEMIWAGEIGGVTEVHAWTNRPWAYWPQGPEVVPKEAPVPPTLDWDAWLADCDPRPYSPAYVPHNWRAFPEFGCGAIGDMACHILGTPNMALRLTPPTSVECLLQEGKGKYTFPKKADHPLRFPGARLMPPVQIFWHDGLTEVPKIRGCGGGRTTRRQGRERQPVHGPERHDHHRLLRRRDAPRAGVQNEGLQVPAQAADALAGAPPGLDSRLQRRRPGVLELQRRRPVRAVDVAGRDRHEVRGQARMGCRAKSRIANNNAANQYLKPKFRKGWKFA